MFGFVVSGLVSPVLRRVTGWEVSLRLRNKLSGRVGRNNLNSALVLSAPVWHEESTACVPKSQIPLR